MVGTGSLARSTCLAMSLLVDRPLRLVVVGRTASKVNDLVHASAVRARLIGAPVQVDGEVAPDPRTWSEVLARLRPAGVLLASSTQSPWEGTTSPSAWTDLLGRVGFGVTLPFHTELAIPLAEAARDCGAWLVNACFPDAVNPLLNRLGLPVLCGPGNVAILAAHLRLALGVADPARLHVVAHHRHLHPDDQGEARVWLDEVPQTDVGALLASGRSTVGERLNDITGLTTAQLLLALLGDEMRPDHCPGPLGLPGGYPVHAGRGIVQLRLPRRITEQEALLLNEEAAVRDGVVVERDRVRFTGLGEDSGDLPTAFAVADLPSVTQLLNDLRERLRALPAGVPAPALVEGTR